MEFLLDQWEEGGDLSHPFDLCSDVARVLSANYVLLREDEEPSLCGGLTKPPIYAIGPFLPPRSLGDIREGDICLFGAPFDTAWVPPLSPAHGPGVIRKAFLGNQLRSRDALPNIYDVGDVLKWPEDGLGIAGKRIEHLMRLICGASAFPILLGGDHSITYFALKALGEMGGDFALLHLDAHPDFSLGGDRVPLNHANVVSHCMTLSALKHVTQVGLRSRVGAGRPTQVTGQSLTVADFRRCGTAALVKQLPQLPLYLSVDLDVLDPLVAPEVTTPLAGGLEISELVELVSAVASQRNLIGADLVEVCAAPHVGNRAARCAADILSTLIAQAGFR
jgi:agmatinase